MAARSTAFLKRAFTQDSRTLSQHVMRGALALIVLLVFVNQLGTSLITFAAGRRFASNILLSFYLFLTAIGLMYFAAAITEEKDEDTLPLLRMTGISNAGLLLGKSLPRLAIVVLLLLIVFPFLVLSVTMGGVIRHQLLASILALFCYTVFLNQLGLLASTLGRNTRQAFSLSTFGCLAFELGFLILWLLSATFQNLQWTAAADASLRAYSWLRARSMWMMLDSHLTADPLDPIWQPQMTFHLVTACVLFVISLLVFNVFCDRALSQDTGQTAGARPKLRRRLTAAGRPRQSPLAWKSWVFICGGKGMFFLRLFGLPAFGFLLVVSICLAVGEMPENEMFSIAFIMLGVIFFALETGRSLGRVLNDEIQQKTLVSLFLIPRTTSGLLRPLIIGSLPAVIPAVCCFGLGWFIVALQHPDSIADFFDDVLVEPWFWHSWTWVLMTGSLTLALSCWMRYGAFLAALALMSFGAMFVVTGCAMLMFYIGGMSRGGDEFMQYVVPMIMIVGEVIGSVLLLRLTVVRTEALAGR